MDEIQPGLFRSPIRPSGILEQAATRTVRALTERETLDPERHALTVALVLRLARAVDAGLDAPKLTIATTSSVAQLAALLDKLPGLSGTADQDAAAALEQLREALR